MSKDYSKSILHGNGNNDYAKYMQTEILLTLQQEPEKMLHRDELLFQIVHQTTELWLKHAGFELSQVIAKVSNEDIDDADLLLGRASFAIQLITQQLDMLKHISPADFQKFRSALGNGSGFESPGWTYIRNQSNELQEVFTSFLLQEKIDLLNLYTTKMPPNIYRLAEAMIDFDEQIALWRTKHYKIALRIIGNNTVGTKGTPIGYLNKLINHQFFKELWAVRTQLTEMNPL